MMLLAYFLTFGVGVFVGMILEGCLVAAHVADEPPPAETAAPVRESGTMADEIRRPVKRSFS